MQFGIGCVLAPSFADIFYENAFRNEILSVGLPRPDVVAELDAAISTQSPGQLLVLAMAFANPDRHLRMREIAAHGLAHNMQPPKWVQPGAAACGKLL